MGLTVEVVMRRDFSKERGTLTPKIYIIRLSTYPPPQLLNRPLQKKNYLFLFANGSTVYVVKTISIRLPRVQSIPASYGNVTGSKRG